MKKKIISLLLVFALCVGISTTAMAAEGAFTVEYGMDLPESSYSAMWVGDCIEIDANSYTYEVLSGAENVKLDLVNSSLTFIKAGTADIKVTAKGSGEPTIYKFTVSPAEEAYVEYQIPQNIKVGYTVGIGGGSAVDAPNAYVYHNCLLGSRYGGMISMEDFYPYGFVSNGWVDPFFPDLLTRKVRGFWAMTFTRPGTTYIKIDDNGTKPYAITIEEPVINTNLPQRVQVGTAMQMTTHLDNTELEDKKIEEIKNRHIYDTKAALGYQPIVEIVSGKELVKRENGDYSNILSSSESITFTGEGTVTFKVTYKMLPLEAVDSGEAISAGAEVLYSPEATFSVNVVTKEEIPIEKLTLSTSMLELIEGEEQKLDVTISPGNSTDDELTWISSNKNIVTVDEQGNVRALSAGEAIITVQSSNGIEDTCKVYVSQGNSFGDISKQDWFYKYIVYVNDKSLMTGLDKNHFAPYENLARAQFAVILHRMNNTPKVEYTERFPDVAPEVWYTDAILWASNIGVVTGYTDSGLFGTGDNINREQMAVMMYRYAKCLSYDTSIKVNLDRFYDADKVNDFASDAMQWAVGNGIITGKEEGTILDPQGNASRAECAAIIMRFLEKYGR